MCASSRHMLKIWRALTRFPVQSTFRRFKMTSSSSGTLSNPSLRSMRNKRTASSSRLSMTVWSVHCARLLTAARALGSLSHHLSSQFLRPQISSITSVSANKIPLLHLKRRMGTQREYSSNLTGVYFDVLHEIATSSMTFKDKNALITGVGKGSISVCILPGIKTLLESVLEGHYTVATSWAKTYGAL